MRLGELESSSHFSGFSVAFESHASNSRSAVPSTSYKSSCQPKWALWVSTKPYMQSHHSARSVMLCTFGVTL